MANYIFISIPAFSAFTLLLYTYIYIYNIVTQSKMTLIKIMQITDYEKMKKRDNMLIKSNFTRLLFQIQ